MTPKRLVALRRLEEAANVVVILATCRDASARAERRDRADPLLNRRDALDALGHDSIEDYLRVPEREHIRSTMQREFDLPMLEVTTDDGYEPPLEAIVEWVIGSTRR